MIKLIIFDLDGTIGNTLPLCIAAFQKSVEPYAGRTISEQEIIGTFGPSEEGTILALIPHRYEQGVADYLFHYRNLHGLCAQPFEGMLEILQYIKSKGLRIALVTGKGERSTEITLDVFRIKHFFDAIETGSPNGPRKVEGIRNVLKHMGVVPHESIYVGDAPSDITSSREAGVPVISAAWAETADPDQLAAMNPNKLFSSVSEFKQYLETFC